jgi:hypothetical protein
VSWQSSAGAICLGIEHQSRDEIAALLDLADRHAAGLA